MGFLQNEINNYTSIQLIKCVMNYLSWGGGIHLNGSNIIFHFVQGKRLCLCALVKTANRFEQISASPAY